ncbi:glycosyltransferase family 4 protein [Exilibacterium tricleocarpae]|uniref:Glycosyltransferase family 4 protein n=1 Tax=Exilibacterium tricleocarpae TaxID=2591008 RepID=A0A545SLZ5_9GAMM|nr:glycosyltransferase family 4 protein [Exilibacterium tricleocarpae]TQV65981.1 glycosyltransferase family 4 protein [Exilibacterium tricleocarpae]
MTAQASLSTIDPPTPDTTYPVTPLRICLLGYRSHPHVGGQGIYLKYLSKALVEAGHQVDVLSGPPYPELDPRVGLIKLPSLNLFEADNHVTALRWRHLRSFSDTFEWFTMLTGGFAEPYTFGRRAVKYLRQHGHRYDLVHDNQSLCYGLLTLQQRGLPTVATLHHPITRDRELALQAAPTWQHRLLVRRWHSFLRMQRKVVRKLQHVITVSAQSQADIATAFGRPTDAVDLIYNGIDTDTFAPRPHITRQPMRIMTTASADQPLKGLRYLLEAIAQLRPHYPDLTLLVIGKLDPKGQTRRLLDKLGLNRAVQFVSGISTEAMVDYYASASIAVSPSLYEGFGLPAGEAMACAVPVISSDGGALPEVVGDAGVVVRAGDSAALADALRQLLDDPERRRYLGAAGRRRILERFCWRVAAQQLSRYYHSVIEKQAPDRAAARLRETTGVA